MRSTRILASLGAKTTRPDAGMGRSRRRDLLCLFSCTLAVFSGATSSRAQSLQVEAIRNDGTTDGGVVVIEFVADGFPQSPGYALVFDYDVVAMVATASSTAAPDPAFSFGQRADCDLIEQRCVGANGGNFSSQTISSSLSTFMLSGLGAGTVVNWTTDNSNISLWCCTPQPSMPSGSFTVIPEPGTAFLLAAGLFGFTGRKQPARAAAPPHRRLQEACPRRGPRAARP